MPDDHSKLVPLLPIPNRTVKRLSADDSADSRVKVGHRQALTARNARLIFDQPGVFFCPFDLCVWLVPSRMAVPTARMDSSGLFALRYPICG